MSDFPDNPKMEVRMIFKNGPNLQNY